MTPTMDTVETRVTKEVVEFVSELEYAHLPAEAVRIGKRCVLDGLGVTLAGAGLRCAEIVRAYSLKAEGKKEATVLGKRPSRAPAPLAALANGTAGHAMDWDDTQLSTTPDRIFGLLTHPTIPVLSTSLAVSEQLGNVSGERFLTAFLAGFEIECKVAEAISPDHYLKGFHTSGTVGTLGAAVSAAKLMGLDRTGIRHAIGLAASMGSGIRANFGTMTKPLHVGRAAQNGVVAAGLAGEGFQADPEGLDGRWGFFQVFGGGFDPGRILGRLGNGHTIVDPGVSIKPYPCGSLTHPSMDAMLALVTENDLQPEEIHQVVLYAGTNILNPIRYRTAENEYQAKFCMPFLLAAIALERRAGVREFSQAFIDSPRVQQLMSRIQTEVDPQIEARGWDKMRSRLQITLRDGRRLEREAGEYRGGPDHPLSDEELGAKFADCTRAYLGSEARRQVVEMVSGLEGLDQIESLMALLY